MSEIKNVQMSFASNVPYLLDLTPSPDYLIRRRPTPFKRRVDKAEFAINAVGVNSGSGVYSNSYQEMIC